MQSYIDLPFAPEIWDTSVLAESYNSGQGL